MTNFEEILRERKEEMDGLLEAYLPEEEGMQKTIFKAMNYSIKIGGKRLRPIFMQEMYRCFAADDSEEEKAEPFFAAIEMLHTYSLVHDDLPAMDDDKYRRGSLTTHAEFGEAIGVLAGDALLNFSFETACKAFGREEDAEWNLRVIKAIKVFGAKAGVYGMIGGQTVDVEKTGRPLTEEEIEFIYELKTCALIEASMLIGAILGGASSEALAIVEKMASCIGMAFQIRDDILDLIGDEGKLGKSIHSDQRNSKTTYVSLHGLEASKNKIEELSTEAKKLAQQLSVSEFLQELIAYLTKREY